MTTSERAQVRSTWRLGRLTGTGANPGVASGQTVTVTGGYNEAGIAVSMTNDGTINVDSGVDGATSMVPPHRSP